MTAEPMTATSQSHARDFMPPILLGLGLGIAAFVPDALGEPAAYFVEPLFSSGFAWGLAALISGYTASRQQASPVAGGVTLTVAVVVYYPLILFVSRRWYVDALHSADGVASSSGLASVGRALLFWTVGAVIGGALLGWLGWAARSAMDLIGDVAIGATFGLLAGESLYTLLWYQINWVGGADTFFVSKISTALVQIGLLATALGLMLYFRRRVPRWPLMTAVGAASLLANLAVWHFMRNIQLAL